MKQLFLLTALYFTLSLAACNNSGEGDGKSDTTYQGENGRNPAEDTIPGAGNNITRLDSSNPKRDSEDHQKKDSDANSKDTSAQRH